MSLAIAVITYQFKLHRKISFSWRADHMWLSPANLMSIEWRISKWILSCHRFKHVKVDVNLSLCFNWAPRHTGVEIQLHAFLTSALDGGERSASRPGLFTPRGRAPDTHWIGGWVGPRAVLDAVVKRKIPSPCRDSNPQLPLSYPYRLKFYSFRW
jgi:hypothetical protein